jgi:hypothetical protein
MTATTTETRPRGARRITLTWVIPVVFALAAILLVVSLTLGVPGRETLRFDNRTGVAVRITASDDGRNGWLPVATADPHGRFKVEEVIDQGDVWRFRYEVGPDRIAEVRRTRGQLEAASWTVVIPADAADALSSRRR